MKTAAYFIKNLQLVPHPEGGYFRETYRAHEKIVSTALPKRYTGARSFSTAIYFLLQSNECSRLHRIKSDELWHFYSGASLSVHVFLPDGEYTCLTLGEDLDKGAVFQFVVPAGSWFGAKVNSADSFSLVGCTVAPGFDFDDFELGNQRTLIELYPAQKEIIKQLTP